MGNFHRADLSGDPVFCQGCGRLLAVRSNDESTLLKTAMFGSTIRELSPSDELDNLFADGVALLAQDKTEDALLYLQRVLNYDPTYDNGRLASYVKDLLRQKARQFYQAAKWQQEAEAWKALLRLDPGDEQALERLPIAEINFRRAPMYERARRFTNVGDFAVARNLLKDLWLTTPYYGDPAGLAEKVGLHIPLPLTGSRKLKWSASVVGSWLLISFSIMLFFISLFSALHTTPHLSVNTVLLCLVTIIAVIGTVWFRIYTDQLREKWFLTRRTQTRYLYSDHKYQKLTIET
jgi:tetratricopeptide (TPR) repeat protein